MEIQPINLPELCGVILGMTLVIIPVFGATIRFAARPFVEALITSGLVRRGEQITGSDNGKLIRRIQELELEVALLKSKDVDLLRQRVS